MFDAYCSCCGKKTRVSEKYMMDSVKQRFDVVVYRLDIGTYKTH
jgi:hypothetical protein